MLYLYIFDRVVTPHVERILGGIHHRVTGCMQGKQCLRLLDDRWDNPSLGEAEKRKVRLTKYFNNSDGKWCKIDTNNHKCMNTVY